MTGFHPLRPAHRTACIILSFCIVHTLMCISKKEMMNSRYSVLCLRAEIGLNYRSNRVLPACSE